MKKTFVLCAMLLAAAALFANTLNVVLKDGSTKTGTVIGKTSTELYLKTSEDRVEIIPLTDVRAAFDMDTGKPYELAAGADTAGQKEEPSAVAKTVSGPVSLGKRRVVVPPPPPPPARWPNVKDPFVRSKENASGIIAFGPFMTTSFPMSNAESYLTSKSYTLKDSFLRTHDVEILTEEMLFRLWDWFGVGYSLGFGIGPTFTSSSDDKSILSNPMHIDVALAARLIPVSWATTEFTGSLYLEGQAGGFFSPLFSNTAALGDLKAGSTVYYLALAGFNAWFVDCAFGYRHLVVPVNDSGGSRIFDLDYSSFILRLMVSLSL